MGFFNSKGILGINARNLLYIKPFNPKKAIKLADDKIKTKQFLSAREIPVPKLYNIIRTTEELNKFDFNTLPSTFVVKPNNGYGGEGIIPIVGKKDDYWITAGGSQINKNDMIDHISDILDGRFSISNVSDTAFFEQYIVSDERVGKFSYAGLPDVRVVVHNLIPVMAMLRLPTKESKGKANLHLGAVGIGIDIGKGEATYICYKNRIIEELPNGLGKIKGLKIPYWDDILLIASKVQLLTNLGYMAVDISIDKNSGPVLLEINARAGLGVQIANLAPLRRRLERIQGIKVSTPSKGVRIAKDMFGNIIEKEIAQISGKELIGTEEDIEVIQKNQNVRLSAKIDTNKTRSVIDEETAIKNGLLENPENYDDEKSTLKIKFAIRNKRIQTVVDIEKIAHPKYKMIIGTRDLQGFLIDINQNKEKAKKIEPKTEEQKPVIISHTKVNFQEVDDQLNEIDNKIKLLYHLRPINLEGEKTRFFESNEYNPQFEYPSLKFDPIELVDKLNQIQTDDTPLGIIFEEKKQEISNKIALLEKIDEHLFTDFSIRLFGKPETRDLEICEELLKKINFHKVKKDEPTYDANQAKEKFDEIFASYGMQHWKAKIKENMVSDCVAGKNYHLFIAKNAKFSEERIQGLIVHEIETHILSAENGKHQPYSILNSGLAKYLITQEGLAMYNVETQRNKAFEENYKAIAHVFGINEAIKSSFRETFNKLIQLGIPKETAFRSALKAKRGLADTSQKGAFTKDYIYFKGYFEIKEFLKNGGDLKDLYMGKINVKDVNIVKSIPQIKPAKILPHWLN